jgi:exopolyphosphatase/guanosine-5'-triphosphate,3'-diphosphate pyrophosphatase
MIRRVASIVCGTNSISMLICDIDHEQARLSDVVRTTRVARLGEGLDRAGRLSPAALDRTMTVLAGYAGQVGRLAPDAAASQCLRVSASNAIGDAENLQEFRSGVKEVLGVGVEVIGGGEQAWLTFQGATRGLSPGVPVPCLVASIGGTSTQIAIGDPDGRAGTDTHGCRGGSVSDTSVWGADTNGTFFAGTSAEIGCLRLTERHLQGDPPLPREVAAATTDIDAALDLAASTIYDCEVMDAILRNEPEFEPVTLIGLAGSVTTVAGIALGLTEYEPARIHHTRVSAGTIHDIASQLLGQTRQERTAIGVMDPGHADVIGAGVLILDRIMTRFGFSEVLASEHGILDGTAWDITDRIAWGDDL